LVPGSSEKVDYKRLILRLTAHASMFLNTSQFGSSERVLQGTGLSPEDFAVQVVENFAVGEIKYDGSKGEAGLIALLTLAMEHDILDALDRAEHRLANFLDPVAVTEEASDRGEKALADMPDKEPDDPVSRLDEEAFKARIYSLVEEDRELKEMAFAILEVDALKPRGIATVCTTSTDEIQNRKKRLSRIVSDAL